jgi:hypothetical protein
MIDTKVTELIHSIDPSLTLVKRFLTHSRGAFGVCLVKDSELGDDYVLKWSRKANAPRRIFNAVRVLRSTPDIDQKPELVRVYAAEHPALLKSYLPGTTFRRQYGEFRAPQELYEPVKKLVDQFHKRGISGVDPVARNLLLSNDDVYLFDFNSTVFKDEDSTAYVNGIEDDLQKLRGVFLT